MTGYNETDISKGGKNMKLWKKILCLVLVLAVALAVVACGSFEPRMIVGMQKMSKLESLHSDTTISADLMLSMLGMDVPVKLTIHVAGDHQRDPNANLIDAELSLPDLGFDQSLLFYIRSDGETNAVYTSWDDGKSWVGESRKAETPDETDPQATPDVKTGDLFKLAMGLGSYFSEVEDAQDKDSVVYEGVLPAEIVQELLLNLDLSALEEALPEGTQLDPTALAGELPVVLALDKESSMITRVELDLTACATAAAENLLQLVLEQYGLADSSITMRIDGFRIASELSQFDSVTVTPPALPAV